MTDCQRQGQWQYCPWCGRERQQCFPVQPHKERKESLKSQLDLLEIARWVASGSTLKDVAKRYGYKSTEGVLQFVGRAYHRFIATQHPANDPSSGWIKGLDWRKQPDDVMRAVAALRIRRCSYRAKRLWLISLVENANAATD